MFSVRKSKPKGHANFTKKETQVLFTVVISKKYKDDICHVKGVKKSLLYVRIYT